MADRPFGSLAPSAMPQPAPSMLDKLSRTWPVEALRAAIAAAALPGDVYSGKTQMGLGTVSDDPTAADYVGNAGPTGQVMNPDVIGRSTDLAGLVMSGTGFGVTRDAGEAALGSGPVHRAASLSMDQESRMARAKAQGYNVDEPVFHETNKSFDEFKPQYGSQVWFTTDPTTIGENGAAGGGSVIKALLKTKNLAGWDEYDKYGTDELMRMGFDGARLGKDIVIFDPKAVRSVNAAFDPAKAKSGKLLGSGPVDVRGAPFGLAPMIKDDQ